MSPLDLLGGGGPPGMPAMPGMGAMPGADAGPPAPQLDPQQLMTFLAGAGLPALLESLTKLMPKSGNNRNMAAPSAQLPHRAGMRIEATPGGGSPQTTIAPSMLQALMQQGGGGMGAPQPPQSAPNPQQLLAMLASGGGGM